MGHQVYWIYSYLQCTMGKQVIHSRESTTGLFAVKSVARKRGDVIMIENDIKLKKGVTKELKPPGQHLKTNC